jgi:hypothetical protein
MSKTCGWLMEMEEREMDSVYRSRPLDDTWKEQALADLAEVSSKLGMIGTIRQSTGGAIHLVIDDFWSIVYKRSIAKFNIFSGYRRNTNRLVKRVATIDEVVGVMRREMDKMEQTRQEFRV